MSHSFELDRRIFSSFYSIAQTQFVFRRPKTFIETRVGGARRLRKEEQAVDDGLELKFFDGVIDVSFTSERPITEVKDYGGMTAATLRAPIKTTAEISMYTDLWQEIQESVSSTYAIIDDGSVFDVPPLDITLTLVRKLTPREYDDFLTFQSPIMKRQFNNFNIPNPLTTETEIRKITLKNILWNKITEELETGSPTITTTLTLNVTGGIKYGNTPLLENQNRDGALLEQVIDFGRRLADVNRDDRIERRQKRRRRRFILGVLQGL